jgi:hypothetical protein
MVHIMSTNKYNATLKRSTDQNGTALPEEIVEAYGSLCCQIANRGWDGFFMTIMFHHIPGPRGTKIRQMHEEISTIYGKLANRVVRKPTSENWAHLLPKGVFFPDVPGYRKTSEKLSDVSVNDGVHMHGIVFAIETPRFKQSLDQHFRENEQLYVNGNIHRIHVEPITDREKFVADYAGKAIKRKRFSNDDILILPKALSELSKSNTLSQTMSREQRAVKDIQSRHNVSDEIALYMYRTQSSTKDLRRGD